jgi:MFS family permease
VKAAERRGLLVAFAVFGVFWGAWATTLPALRHQVGASDGRLGLALGSTAVAAIPVMPLSGRLVDRLGASRALPACLIGFGVVLPLGAFTHSVTALALSCALLGLATGALDVVANAAAAAWERLEQDKVMSLVHGAFSAGVLIGAVATGAARQAGAGPVPVLTTVGVLVVLAAILQPSYRKAPTPDMAPTTRASRRRIPAALIGIGLLTAAAFLCEDAIQSWSALHLERDLDAGPGIAGLGPGLFAGAMAIGRFAGSPLARRWSDQRMLAGAGALLSLGAFTVGIAPSTGIALVGFVVAGAGTSVLAPVLYSAVGDRAQPGSQGADLAIVSMLGYAGFVAGPPIVGGISAAASLPFALGCLAALGLLLAVLGPLTLSGKMRA